VRARHGEEVTVNVFPALPVSLAVEAGRVWMPKSDLPMLILYRSQGRGFISTLKIW